MFRRVMFLVVLFSLVVGVYGLSSKLVISPLPQSDDQNGCTGLDLDAGWNLVSFPIEDINLPKDITPYTLNDGRYWEVKTPLPGRGYWVYSVKPRKIEVCGSTVDRVEWYLSEGKHLLGGPYSEVSVDEVRKILDTQVGEGRYKLEVYEYSQDKYQPTKVIRPFVGYLVEYDGPETKIVLGGRGGGRCDHTFIFSDQVRDLVVGNIRLLYLGKGKDGYRFVLYDNLTKSKQRFVLKDDQTFSYVSSKKIGNKPLSPGVQYTFSLLNPEVQLGDISSSRLTESSTVSLCVDLEELTCIYACTNITEPGYYLVCDDINADDLPSSPFGCINIMSNDTQLRCGRNVITDVTHHVGETTVGITAFSMGSDEEILPVNHVDVSGCTVQNFSLGFYLFINRGSVYDNLALSDGTGFEVLGNDTRFDLNSALNGDFGLIFPDPSRNITFINNMMCNNSIRDVWVEYLPENSTIHGNICDTITSSEYSYLCESPCNLSRTCSGFGSPIGENGTLELAVINGSMYVYHRTGHYYCYFEMLKDGTPIYTSTHTTESCGCHGIKIDLPGDYFVGVAVYGTSPPTPYVCVRGFNGSYEHVDTDEIVISDPPHYTYITKSPIYNVLDINPGNRRKELLSCDDRNENSSPFTTGIPFCDTTLKFYPYENDTVITIDDLGSSVIEKQDVFLGGDFAGFGERYHNRRVGYRVKFYDMPDGVYGIPYLSSTPRIALRFLGDDWVITRWEPPIGEAPNNDLRRKKGGVVCLGREITHGVLGVNDTLHYRNYVIRLEDVGEGDHPAFLEIIDNDTGILLSYITIHPGETGSCLDEPCTFKIHVWRTIASYNLSERRADLSVIDPVICLEDGENLTLSSEDGNWTSTVYVYWKNYNSSGSDWDALREIILVDDQNYTLEEGDVRSYPFGEIEYAGLVNKTFYNLSFRVMDHGITDCDGEYHENVVEITYNYPGDGLGVIPRWGWDVYPSGIYWTPTIYVSVGRYSLDSPTILVYNDTAGCYQGGWYNVFVYKPSYRGIVLFGYYPRSSGWGYVDSRFHVVEDAGRDGDVLREMGMINFYVNRSESTGEISFQADRNDTSHRILYMYGPYDLRDCTFPNEILWYPPITEGDSRTTLLDVGNYTGRGTLLREFESDRVTLSIPEHVMLHILNVTTKGVELNAYPEITCPDGYRPVTLCDPLALPDGSILSYGGLATGGEGELILNMSAGSSVSWSGVPGDVWDLPSYNITIDSVSEIGACVNVSYTTSESGAVRCDIVPWYMTVEEGDFTEFDVVCYDEDDNVVDCPDGLLVVTSPPHSVVTSPSGGYLFLAGDETGLANVIASYLPAGSGAGEGFSCAGQVNVTESHPTCLPLYIKLYDGWNLISFPVTPDDLTLSDILTDHVYVAGTHTVDPGCVDRVVDPSGESHPEVYRFDSSTETFVLCDDETPQPGIGYVVHADHSCVIGLDSGESVNADGLYSGLPSGWNLIGGGCYNNQPMSTSIPDITDCFRLTSSGDWVPCSTETVPAPGIGYLIRKR